MQEGAYRFIRNPNVSAEAIRKAGAMQTVKLAQEFPELLAIEDTTSLSYRHRSPKSLASWALFRINPADGGFTRSLARGHHIPHRRITASGVVDAPG